MLPIPARRRGSGRERPAAGHDRGAVDRTRRVARISLLGITGPIAERVSGGAKDELLAIIDECMAAGWSLEPTGAVLQIDRRRVWRWQARRDRGLLNDCSPGGNPIHGHALEVEAILELAEEWAPMDRSHRRLAYRDLGGPPTTQRDH
jgi:hypothetical protein